MSETINPLVAYKIKSYGVLVQGPHLSFEVDESRGPEVIRIQAVDNNNNYVGMPQSYTSYAAACAWCVHHGHKSLEEIMSLL